MDIYFRPLKWLLSKLAEKYGEEMPCDNGYCIWDLKVVPFEIHYSPDYEDVEYYSISIERSDK